MITAEEIRERLNIAIKESGITQKEIARRLGINQSAIAQYKMGRALPALDTLANLCKIIDVSPAYILCFDEDESGRRTNTVKNSFNHN